MTDTDTTVLQEARNSFTGKTLTESQFGEAWSIAEIMHGSIKKTGSFTEKLTDYSHAFARSEKFDTLRAESIIRDIFKAQNGQTMNQMREGLLAREAGLPESATTQALKYARLIEPMIRDGETMPFYRAYDHAGYNLAGTLGITEMKAKELMKTAFSEAEGKELYETGKAWEKAYHEPVREAARRERAASRSQAKSRSYA